MNRYENAEVEWHHAGWRVMRDDGVIAFIAHDQVGFQIAQGIAQVKFDGDSNPTMTYCKRWRYSTESHWDRQNVLVFTLMKATMSFSAKKNDRKRQKIVAKFEKELPEENNRDKLIELAMKGSTYNLELPRETFDKAIKIIEEA